MSTVIVDSALRDRRAWVVWRTEQPPDRKRPTKPPYVAGPGERRADVTNPEDLRTFAEATAVADRFDGIGVALGDGLCGADLDHCRNPATGEIATWARRIIELLNSYTEVSPSGTGLHILVWGELPPGVNRRRYDRPGGGRIELYDRDRYFTFTGEHLEGTPKTIEHRAAELAEVYHGLFDERVRDGADEPATANPPAPKDLPDDALLRAAFESVTGSEIAALWRGDDLHYPTPSEADAALAHHLAFYVRDAAHLEALLRQSGRVRAKWDTSRNGDTWIGRECAAAVADVQERYSGTLPDLPGLVRIDRRLLRLPDGPLLAAALQAAGIESDGELATLCGVTERTVRDWRRTIIDAGLEEAAATRPRRRFVLVAVRQLTHSGLTIGERVTGIHLATFANAGVAQIGVEALAEARGCKRWTITQHTKALNAVGLIASWRAPFDEDTKRRECCNMYLLTEVATALERATEARESDSSREKSHGLAEAPPKGPKTVRPPMEPDMASECPAEARESTREREITHGPEREITRESMYPQEGEELEAVAVDGGSTPEAPPKAESASQEGESRSGACEDAIGALVWKRTGRRPNVLDIAAELEFQGGDAEMAVAELVEQMEARNADAEELPTEEHSPTRTVTQSIAQAVASRGRFHPTSLDVRFALARTGGDVDAATEWLAAQKHGDTKPFREEPVA